MGTKYEKLLAETIAELKSPRQPMFANHFLSVDDSGEMTINIRGFKFTGNLSIDKDVKNILSVIGLHKFGLEMELQTIKEAHGDETIIDVRSVPLDAIQEILSNYMFKKSFIQ